LERFPPLEEPPFDWDPPFEVEPPGSPESVLSGLSATPQP
jgi:hypothetical protein